MSNINSIGIPTSADNCVTGTYTTIVGGSGLSISGDYLVYTYCTNENHVFAGEQIKRCGLCVLEQYMIALDGNYINCDPFSTATTLTLPFNYSMITSGSISNISTFKENI